MAKERKIHRVPVKTARLAIIAVAVLCMFISFKTWKETRQKEAIVRENRKKIETRTKEIKETGAAIRNSDSLEFAEKEVMFPSEITSYMMKLIVSRIF